MRLCVSFESWVDGRVWVGGGDWCIIGFSPVVSDKSKILLLVDDGCLGSSFARVWKVFFWAVQVGESVVVGFCQDVGVAVGVFLRLSDPVDKTIEESSLPFTEHFVADGG